ncbi:unnamed protein product [Rodentolepis nana]|uniref:Uncharacterized protein n=1 Tax=Rodentolepis nana TaxID=102285 RepID=A0A0R3T6R2_RODNA|nr:unnamed protein product [Rodentolepis nana]
MFSTLADVIPSQQRKTSTDYRDLSRRFQTLMYERKAGVHVCLACGMSTLELKQSLLSIKSNRLVTSIVGQLAYEDGNLQSCFLHGGWI